MLTTESFGRSAGRLQLARLHEAFAEPCHQVALGLGQVVVEAVDRLSDHPPLGEPGDGAQGAQACLELERHPDAELWIIFYLLPVLASRRTAYLSTTVSDVRVAFVGHGRGLAAQHSAKRTPAISC